MSDESRMSYGARCPGCNHLVGATVDAPEYRDDVAAAVAEWVRDGLIIERLTVGEVRKQFDLCTCNQLPETLPLFALEPTP